MLFKVLVIQEVLGTTDSTAGTCELHGYPALEMVARLYHMEQLHAIFYDTKEIHACYAAAGLTQFLIAITHVLVVHAVVRLRRILIKHTRLGVHVIVHVVINLV